MDRRTISSLVSDPVFGKRLRDWRKQNHITQEDLGSRAGLSGTTVFNIEHGYPVSLCSFTLVRNRLKKEFTMGMSMNIIAFAKPTPEWYKMKAVYEACADAKIPVPREVENFFNGNEPDPDAFEIEIEKTLAVSKHNDEGEDGYEVELALLPEGVTRIRFFNSY